MGTWCLYDVNPSCAFEWVELVPASAPETVTARGELLDRQALWIPWDFFMDGTIPKKLRRAPRWDEDFEAFSVDLDGQMMAR